MNLSMDYLSQDAVTGKQRLYAVSSNSTRFGIRGTEPLQNGWSAIFQLENSVNADAGSGTLAGRASFVGLSSKTLGTHFLATYGYALSKRTALYAGYAHLNNDANATYILPVVKIIGVPGATESGFSAGIWHNF